ncbi:hypothetical protein P879_07339 [Paragonimus westermani]|uniref:Uncharacterized protein n=1 Tax=Paragonimus westermani TaxID=34504 RepID=A0A8T0DNG1_9TREM|nr:hypothetical protein P879_07339 [Paragonimus westermani]
MRLKTKTKTKLNSFDEMQEQLDKETDRLETYLIGDKPWHLKGEVIAQDREENTVLEEHLEVQRHGAFKPPPTDESKILEFIMRTIKDQSFGSPTFKVKPKPTQNAQIQALPVNPSQKSLVEDYENLFAKNSLLEREQDDPVKNTIQKEMCHLFETLDALSHSHFVPFKHSSEVTVVQNKPALTMEETGQEVVSTADLLAPEEVCPPRGEVLKGSTEITSSDRRRHRKKLMRIRSKRLKFGTKTDVTKDKKAALARVLRMAHKPGSKIKVV